MGPNTLISWIDHDGYMAAKALHRLNADVASLVAPGDLTHKVHFIGMLIIVGHGSTILNLAGRRFGGRLITANRMLGLHQLLGDCAAGWITLAACEVGTVHTNIGEMQSIAQGLANLRDRVVYGTKRGLPIDDVKNGTCFYRSPLFQWLQPADDNNPGLWQRFGKQTDEEQNMSMMSYMNINTM